MKIYKFVGTVTRHISPIFAKDIIAYLQKIQGDFLIKTYNKSFDMRSILGLVSLAIEEGDNVTVLANIKEEDLEKVNNFMKSFITIKTMEGVDEHIQEKN